uniref:Uncharacterized protein n=1 Tax=Myotis myotis TaxID=51298 RepID=A0A7J8AMF9_MYOMY|nr:hypothetical protein mMyoMyo1_008098 [Myotis myotis]
MFAAVGSLQIKEEGVLQFFATETHLGGTNFDFHIKRFTYKRKSDGIYINNLKRTFRRQPVPLLPLKTPLMTGSYPPGRPAIQLCGSYCCAKTTPIAGPVVPGSFQKQVQAAFQAPRPSWLLLLGGHQPLAEASFIACLP